jgi:CRISPR-associated protein Cmx8
VAKKEKTKPKVAGPAGEVIRHSYDLYTLPTAQHRAGLAGLILQARSAGFGAIVEEVDPHSATVAVTEANLTALLDDLYDAEEVEVESESKWKGKTPVRVGSKAKEEGGKSKVVPVYTYMQVQPKCPFLARRVSACRFLDQTRRQATNVYRLAPLSKQVYEQRAQNKPCGEGQKFWAKLASAKPVETSSSIRLGAEGKTGDGDLFRGDPWEALLLHFAQVVTLPFSIKQFEIESGRLVTKWRGTASVVPEVADLDAFCDLFPGVVDELALEKTQIVEAPEQAGLDLTRRICDLAVRKGTDSPLEYCVSAAEVYWTERVGVRKTLRIISVSRVDGGPDLGRKYGLIRKQYRSPLFRAVATAALIKDTRIDIEAEPYLHTVPAKDLLSPWFAKDCSAFFRGIHQRVNDTRGAQVNAESIDTLGRIVRTVVNNYLREKVRTLAKVDPFDPKFKNSTGQRLLPTAVVDAWQNACLGLIYDLRSRDAAEFTRYFLAQLCAAGPFLPEADQKLLSRHLIGEAGWEPVKNLTMLAVAGLRNRFRKK